MGQILKGKASWYTAQDSGGNLNVSMMSARICPKCNHIAPMNCNRCGGDGYLINSIPFNPQGMEAALPASLREKHGITYGSLVQVTYKREGLPIQLKEKAIILRINDEGPSERLLETQNRIIDLTPFAFSLLEDTRAGLIDVEVEFL